MSRWEANLALLKRLNPLFADRVLSPSFTDPDLEVHDCGLQGNLILKKAKMQCFLHSSYSIEREMDRMFANVSREDAVLVIFGLGLGHCIDYVRAHGIRYRRLVVYEPVNNVFRELLKRRDIADFLETRNLDIVIGEPDEISRIIMAQALHSPNVCVLNHVSYHTMFGQFHRALANRLKANANSYVLSRNTVLFNLGTWTRNQLALLASPRPSASELLGRFKSVPAIIVSAGPSLERAFDFLKRAGDKALIVTPGSGTRILNKMGIKAHLAMAIDGSKAEVDIFRGFRGGSILLHSFRVDQELESIFPNQSLRFMLNQDHFARYWAEWAGKPSVSFTDYGTVSASAVEFAASMGCDPIILVGQDLCYYEDRMYADDDAANGRDLGTEFVESVDINGDRVRTSRQFLAMQDGMAVLAEQLKGTTEIINCTERGIGIPGVRNASMRETLARYIAHQPADVNAKLQRAVNDCVRMAEMTGESEVCWFFAHVLDKMAEISDIQERRGQAATRLAKQISRGLKLGRLRDQMIELDHLHNRLLAIPFYRRCIRGSLEIVIESIGASVSHQYGEREQNPVAFLDYEAQVYALEMEYMAIVEAIVQECCTRRPCHISVAECRKASAMLSNECVGG